MGNNFDLSLSYGIAAIDYFKSSEVVKQSKTKKLKALEDKFSANEFYRADLLTSSKEYIELYKKNDNQIRPTFEQFEYLDELVSKKVKDPFDHEMNKIRVKASYLSKSSSLEEVENIIFCYKSFAFAHLYSKDHLISETITYTEDVFYNLNNIASFFPELEKEVKDTKELYYPLYYQYFVYNYIYDDNFDYDFTSLIMDCNKYDIDKLFNSRDYIYPREYFNDILAELEDALDVQDASNLTIDGEHYLFGYEEGDGPGYYLQFVLMHNNGDFTDSYDSQYKKFIGDNLSNMYVNKALFAQYDKKRSQVRLLVKHIDESKLTPANLEIYKEIKYGLTPDGRQKLKTRDFSTEVESVLLFDEFGKLPTLLSDAENVITDFCIDKIVRDILDDVRFSSFDIDLILKYAPKTLKSYLLKPTIYIQKGDIENLYKVLINLINLNMLEESKALISSLIEVITSRKLNEYKNYIWVLQTIFELVEIELGYKTRN